MRETCRRDRAMSGTGKTGAPRRVRPEQLSHVDTDYGDYNENDRLQRPVFGVALSRDGKHIVSGSADDTVRLWDIDTGQPIGQPITGHTEQVTSVAFSPDGKRIASGSYDKTVRVWDAATGQPVGQPITGHTGAVYSVAFSPDGHQIVSGSLDTTVRVWPTYPDPASAMCAKLTTNMSHKQWRDWVSPDIDYIKVCPDLPIAPD